MRAGIHIGSLTGWLGATTPMHDLGYTALRMWNTGTTWKRLETSQDTWAAGAVARLNDNARIISAAGKGVLFTLGQPPGWASDTTPDADNSYNPAPPTTDADWVDYLGYVVARLPLGSAYELWNEIDLTSYWDGATARLIELHDLAYDTIKALDPTATFVSASVSSDPNALVAYLDGIAATDVVGVHCYIHPNQPEATIQYLRWVRAVAQRCGFGDKPIWDTESGWGYYKLNGSNVVSSDSERLYTDTNCMAQPLACAYVARWLLAHQIGRTDAAYWYGMDFSYSIRFVTDLDNPVTTTDAAAAYRYWVQFLAGATLSRFRQVPPLYSVDWSKNGASGRIYWCRDDVTQNVDLSGFTSGVDVLGASITLSASYSVTHSPVIVTR